MKLVVYNRLPLIQGNLSGRFYSIFIFVYFQQQRRLDMITITNPDNLDPDETKRVVYCTARVHPGETPASYVCQGMLMLFLVHAYYKLRNFKFPY